MQIEELFLFSPQSMSWLLSLFYNTEFLLGNTRFSLKPEALTMTKLFRSDTIITGWGSKLHSHLLIELSPLCTVLLSVAHSNISSGCFPPQKATMGDYFKLQLQKQCSLLFPYPLLPPFKNRSSTVRIQQWSWGESGHWSLLKSPLGLSSCGLPNTVRYGRESFSGWQVHFSFTPVFSLMCSV